MSLQLNPGTATELAPNRYTSGRAVAAAELRLQIGMADLDGLLEELSKHAEGLFGPDGEADIDAYGVVSPTSTRPSMSWRCR